MNIFHVVSAILITLKILGITHLSWLIVLAIPLADAGIRAIIILLLAALKFKQWCSSKKDARRANV